jgi:hypothetical protein
VKASRLSTCFGGFDEIFAEVQADGFRTLNHLGGRMTIVIFDSLVEVVL